MVAAVIVAHPDDETLWAGGTILAHPDWSWFVATLCRASDPDRAPRFRRALACLNAQGAMGDLDDGPQQAPLPDALVDGALLSLAGGRRFDLVLTHGPRGEYTRHRRHEEVCRAVSRLWQSGRLSTFALWTFAYEDGGGRTLPRARAGAGRRLVLASGLWRRKYEIVTRVYGFGPRSFEAAATPRVEAFDTFRSARAARQWSHDRKSPA